MTLTRAEFDQACKAYISKYCSAQSFDATPRDDALLRRYPAGWSWTEHPTVPGLGYLSRLVSIPSHSSHDNGGQPAEPEVEEPEDEAAAAVPHERLVCRQYVVFSPSFQVPALYFSLHRGNGTALSLDDIVTSSLLMRSALPQTARTTFALETTDSPFAMLSQGDHPTSNTPCWYLHPCRTAEVVDEIMKETGYGDADRPLRWLETWFMVLGNVVDFRVE
ncbi:autophagy protein 10 [Phanerochaete sordida]|uniref:Ubiquitin-like-conjugating enzyme ATG10 n=1 Tax=Phanerochaete sordida TaxID=48140 RepID=A0A9P3L878_9APHY|nr:autophagy protein 10 [Phanerochaete sordida]